MPYLSEDQMQTVSEHLDSENKRRRRIALPCVPTRFKAAGSAAGVAMNYWTLGLALLCFGAFCGTWVLVEVLERRAERRRLEIELDNIQRRIDVGHF